jgi:hypothetical protein
MRAPAPGATVYPLLPAFTRKSTYSGTWRARNRHGSVILPRVTDDPGVMGNLPRSRPGRRSEKRSTASKPPAKGGAKGRASGSAGSTAKKGASGSPPRGAASQAPRAGGGQTARGPDPVGDAVRIAAKVAGTGLGIATGILKRLPRP